LSEKEINEITEKTEKKLSRLLKEYPCIYFISCSGRNNQGMGEICFNEQYLNEIGFSVESFATTVLQEGVPR